MTTTTAEIRTFHARRGRIGVRRRDLLERLGPRYGVSESGGPADPAAWYGRRAPLVLEIGSGMGDATAAMASADPDRNYLAAEVHSAGVANLLGLIEQHGLTNLRVCHGDALSLLRERLAPASLDAVHAFFPDPWPKARHHKRRLFQPGHVALLRSRLRPGGVIYAVTDWAAYADVIQHTLGADPGLALTQPPGGRPVTRYEQRALTAGRQIFEFAARRLD